MDASQLAKHKVGLAMETVTEPQRLQEAVGGLWASYVAVIATLSVRFAQTTAMALGLVECVKLPVARLLAPLLGELLGPKKAHWARTIIESALGIIAMAFAVRHARDPSVRAQRVPPRGQRALARRGRRRATVVAHTALATVPSCGCSWPERELLAL